MKIAMRNDFLQSRLEKLENIIKSEGLDALILTDGYNIHYVSGYRGHCGMLLFAGGRRIIFTDSRYTEQAGIEAPSFECIDIGIDGYYNSMAGILNDIFGSKGNKKLRLGFEDEEISYKRYFQINKVFSENLSCGFLLFAMGDKINELRMVKDKEELELIEKAEEIGDRAFDDILGYIKPGMTEREVALRLEYTMKSLGAMGLSFDTITASGENSSLPHAVPTDRVIRKGDFLTMDFGCIYEGYCSDMTRTVFIGKDIDSEQKMVYDTVLRAQNTALSMIRAGVKCSDVDACARDIISDMGYGNYFGHGLGHSVGLFIHEEPRCSRKCDTVLEAGMLMTCEPGIYLPGKFGVRIEDLVVVTKDGCKNLTHSPKELIYLSADE